MTDRLATIEKTPAWIPPADTTYALVDGVVYIYGYALYREDIADALRTLAEKKMGWDVAIQGVTYGRQFVVTDILTHLPGTDRHLQIPRERWKHWLIVKGIEAA